MENWLQDEIHRMINGKFEHFPDSSIDCNMSFQSNLMERLDELSEKLKEMPKVTVSITFTNNGLRYFKTMIDVVDYEECRYVFSSIPIKTLDNNEELEDNEIKVTYNDGTHQIKKWCDCKQLERFQKAKVISWY